MLFHSGLLKVALERIFGFYTLVLAKYLQGSIFCFAEIPWC